MTPVSQREWEDTSLDSKPRFGPQKPMAVLRVFEIMAGVMFSHHPAGAMMWVSKVEGVALWSLNWSTRRSKAALGVSGQLLSDLSPPDAVLLGCELQRDKVGGLGVACHGCSHKGTMTGTEVIIFNSE